MGKKKIGHAGTLDPSASGVLLILLGQATKIAAYLLEGDRKIYSGTLRLGVETDTWDAEGNVLRECDWQNVQPDTIVQEISAWSELMEQPVPPYSAAKHHGQPLYRLARSGQEVPPKTKAVKIFRSDMLEINMPYVRFRVVCGSGVYVRSLAHSLGKRLGCGATLFELTREYSHPFSLADACDLNDVLTDPALLGKSLRSLGDALPDWPKISLTAMSAAKVRNGIAIPARSRVAERAILCDGSKPLALAELSGTDHGAVWTVTRGLWN